MRKLMLQRREHALPLAALLMMGLLVKPHGHLLENDVKNLLTRIKSGFRSKLRQWLRQNPKALKLLRRFRCFHTDSESLSRGLAIGLFFGLTPTVGFQTPMVLAVCLLVSANFPVAFAATWISNPLTVAPLYLSFNWLGEKLTGQMAILSDTTAAAFPWLNALAGEGVQMAAGSLVLALPAGILGYSLSRHSRLWQGSGAPADGAT